MNSESTFGDLVRQFAGLPGVAKRLHDIHAPTDDGRCPICTAGPQRGHVVHPCTLYTYAELAIAEIARRRS